MVIGGKQRSIHVLCVQTRRYTSATYAKTSFIYHERQFPISLKRARTHRKAKPVKASSSVNGSEQKAGAGNQTGPYAAGHQRSELIDGCCSF